MKQSGRWRIAFWWLVGFCCVTGGVLSVHPQAMLLIYPGLQVRSDFCSRWQAYQDFGVVAKQERFQGEISRGMKLLAADGSLEQWATPDGDYWIPKGSRETLAVLIAQQRREIYGTVTPGETIIDCGAHVGAFLRHALRSGAGKVVAVEPSPDAAECLRRNFASELAEGRAVLVRKGIWDREQLLTFYINGNGDAANSFIVHGSASRALTVPVTSIDRLVEELHLERVGLIKADVKGATARMLAGAQATLRRDQPRMALSTEEPPEDPTTLNRVVNTLQPAYRAMCGPCLAANGQIRTDVMFYQ